MSLKLSANAQDEETGFSHSDAGGGGFPTGCLTELLGQGFKRFQPAGCDDAGRCPSVGGIIRIPLYHIRMRKKVVTVGTSAAVTLSREELAALGVGAGDSVEVTARDGVVEIRPVNPFAGMAHEERVALLDRFGARG